MKKKVIIDETMKRAKSLLILIGLIIIANILTVFIQEMLFLQIVRFATYNIPFLIAISFLFLMGALLLRVEGTLRYFFPVFNAAGTGVLIYFLVEIVEFIDYLLGQNIVSYLNDYGLILCFVVAGMVLLGGYSVLLSTSRREKEEQILENKIKEKKERDEKLRRELLWRQHQEDEKKRLAGIKNEKPKKKKRRSGYKPEFVKETSVPDYRKQI
jgi:hypothetical protein